jgi:hypothetical protein
MVHIEGVTKQSINLQLDLEHWLGLGLKNRTMHVDNATSNIAHTVATIEIVRTKNKREQTTTITMVDLAGSERAKSYQEYGQQKESSSLSALSVVIWQLASNSEGRGPK